MLQVCGLHCITTLSLSLIQGADVVKMLITLTESPLRVAHGLPIAPTVIPDLDVVLSTQDLDCFLFV